MNENAFYLNVELCDAGNGEYNEYEIMRGDCLYAKIYDEELAKKILCMLNAGVFSPIV